MLEFNAWASGKLDDVDADKNKKESMFQCLRRYIVERIEY